MKKHHNLRTKIDNAIGDCTGMNAPATRTKDAIDILVNKIEELEREIQYLKNRNINRNNFDID